MSRAAWSTDLLAALVALLAIATALANGCARRPSAPAEITLATTTSTQDSGLLDELLPAFISASGIKVKVVAVGSGQAMELGRNGDADVLLTHSPAAEEEFMAQGWGASRQPVMHNEFVVLGPEDDPARIRMGPNVADAFNSIAQKQARFVSRGDESGTHQRELQVWKKAETEPAGDWYISAGAGMAPALRMADEMRAYVLSDRATYITLRADLELVILIEGDPLLRNQYSVMTINPKKHQHTGSHEAAQFAEFLLSEQGQRLIGEFGVQKFGEQLFEPNPTR